MNRTIAKTAQRRGFTLIEILVVIAIIAILAALLMGGVMAVMRKGPEVRTRNEFLQLAQGLQKFYGEYKFYPPDRIRLRSNLNSYNPADPTGLDQASISYIRTIWRNIDTSTAMDWTGTGATGAVELEGDQCLVFFLGGIPSGAGQAPIGFSTDPRNPTAATADRKKFLTFDSARIVLLHGNAFPSLMDHYGTKPILYFSSGKRPEGYGNVNTFFSVSPYALQGPPTPKYHNPTTYQLICAGRDGTFGPGGLWTTATATGIATAGKDDLTNFHEKFMGNP